MTIKQAIEALDKTIAAMALQGRRSTRPAVCVVKEWVDELRKSLAAMNTLPGVATDIQVHTIFLGVEVQGWDSFYAGFRAGEQFARRQILGE